VAQHAVATAGQARIDTEDEHTYVTVAAGTAEVVDRPHRTGGPPRTTWPGSCGVKIWWTPEGDPAGALQAACHLPMSAR
jgi:hypothetical protein